MSEVMQVVELQIVRSAWNLIRENGDDTTLR